MTEQQWTIFLLLLVLSSVTGMWTSLLWLGAAGTYAWLNRAGRG